MPCCCRSRAGAEAFKTVKEEGRSLCDVSRVERPRPSLRRRSGLTSLDLCMRISLMLVFRNTCWQVSYELIWSLSVRLSACLSVCWSSLSACLLACQPPCLPVCLSSMNMNMNLSASLQNDHERRAFPKTTMLQHVR